MTVPDSEPEDPAHRIRLRGAWEFHDAPAPIEGEGRRLDLPAPTFPGESRVFALVRRFGRPFLEPSSAALSLEFSACPGVQSIRLNQVELRVEPWSSVARELPLQARAARRNELILIVDRGEALALDRPWGEIALKIRRVGGDDQ